MSTLTYDDKKHDYYVEDWLAAVILGNKALLQKREGKKMLHATFAAGRIQPVTVGTTQNLGGPFTASSKGWSLCE